MTTDDIFKLSNMAGGYALAIYYIRELGLEDDFKKFLMQHKPIGEQK